MFPILSVTVYFLKVLSQESHGTVHYIKGRQTCVVEGVTWPRCTPSRTSCLTMGKAGKAHPGRPRDSLYHQACAHSLSLAWVIPCRTICASTSLAQFIPTRAPPRLPPGKLSLGPAWAGPLPLCSPILPIPHILCHETTICGI